MCDFKPADDLEMVVHTVYMHMFYPVFLSLLHLNKSREDYAPIILEFWQKRMMPTIWKKMIACARELQYEELIHKIKKLI